MIPFFTSRILPGYRAKPLRSSLAVAWLLLLTHLVLTVAGQSRWTWPADFALAALFVAHGVAWQSWKAWRPGLLAVLHLAHLWLPIVFVLFGMQSGALWLDGRVVLGRAPVHALTVGYFGSMLIAMVTRVTQGHSGRPLAMGGVAWGSFVAVQLVAALRIAAEFAADAALWLAIAACAWLLAFLPWVLRSLWIYLTPRVDGQPG